MNPGMHALHPYPFEKLAQLTTGVECPNKDRISLTIGEPKHQPPAHVLEALFNSLNEVSRYPTIGGLPELMQHIATWLQRRFDTRDIDPATEVLPVNDARGFICGCSGFCHATTPRRSGHSKSFLSNLRGSRPTRRCSANAHTLPRGAGLSGKLSRTLRG